MTTDFTKGQDRKMKGQGKQERRWSEREGIARTASLFDGNPHESLGLREPMYSSFHKDHKFVEAPIGKGLCSWEKKRYSSRQDIKAKVKTPPDISVADVEVCPVVQELLPAQANSMFQRVKSMSQTGMMSMASTKASTNIKKRSTANLDAASDQPANPVSPSAMQARSQTLLGVRTAAFGKSMAAFEGTKTMKQLEVE